MAMQEAGELSSLPTDDREADDSIEVLDDDPELVAIRARVKEMEEESEQLDQMQLEAEREIDLISPGTELTAEEKIESDSRSVYVGNVDYSATAEELELHFYNCGLITRVTILCDKYSSNPKGFAYIEFAEKASVATAMALDQSVFRGRNLKVMPKRTNRPGISTTNRYPWGRGARRASRISRFGGYPMRRAARRRPLFWPY